MQNIKATVRCATKETNLCIPGVRVERAASSQELVPVLMAAPEFQLVQQHISSLRRFHDMVIRSSMITANRSRKTARAVEPHMANMLAIAHDATYDCEFIEKNE